MCSDAQSAAGAIHAPDVYLMSSLISLRQRQAEGCLASVLGEVTGSRIRSQPST